jgi:branched-subunit amino acid aminotransferase/4-amino-4-deoxychorismate lyase
MTAWLDGKQIPAPMQALWRGEGVYETLLWRDRPPPAFALHVERMARGAAKLGVAAPLGTELQHAIAQAVGGDRELMRVRVTCLPGEDRLPSLLVEARPALPTELRPQPAKLLLGPRVRNASDWFHGCKHIGIAADLAVRRHAREHGADDVLLRSVTGWWSEAVTATVLVGLDDGRTGTPGPDAAPLPGTTLAQLQVQGLEVEPVLLCDADLPRVRWMLLLNAVCGAREVRRLEGVDLGPAPPGLVALARAVTGAR